jgi:hypothetical protein
MAAEDEQAVARDFDGFLFRGKDGAVRVGDFIVTLGMWGTSGGITEYRLSPPLAEAFAPLVNKETTVPDRRLIAAYDDFLGPNPPTILIGFRGHCVLIKKTEHRMKSPEGEVAIGAADETYEVRDAQLVWVEFLSPEWLASWRALHEALTEIVNVSLTPPGDEKTARLSAAIEKGSRAANAMTRPAVTDEARAIVRRIEPKARVVTMFQRGYSVTQWRNLLEQYAARLGIASSTLLPPRPPEYDLRNALAQSQSPQAFMAAVRKAWPEEALEGTAAYVRDWGRRVYGWEVADLNPQQFAVVRGRVQEYLKARPPVPPPEQKPKASESVPEWGVVLGEVPAPLLAEKKILSGVLVEKAPDKAPASGLQADDIILNYRSIYDTVMGSSGFNSARELANMLRYSKAANFTVLRGDNVIAITLRKN